MTFAVARLLLGSLSVLFLAAPEVPIYPGAKRDMPQALVEKSSGVEAAATYVTEDSFAKVDSFYRAHAVEDTGARRVSATSKRALYYFVESKSDVLILWPKDGTSDKTSIVISKE